MYTKFAHVFLISISGTCSPPTICNFYILVISEWIYIHDRLTEFIWMGMLRKMAKNFFGLVKEVMWSKHIQECSTILLLVAWCAFPFFSWFFLFTVVTKIFAAAYGCQKFMNFSTCIPCLCAPYDLWCHFRSKTIKLDFINDGILKLQFENVQPQINKCTSFTYSFPFPRGPNFLQSLKGHREYSLC